MSLHVLYIPVYRPTLSISRGPYFGPIIEDLSILQIVFRRLMRAAIDGILATQTEKAALTLTSGHSMTAKMAAEFGNVAFLVDK